MTETPDEVTYEKAKAVKEAHQSALMRMANVVGVGVGLQRKGGVGTGKVALIVMVEKKLPVSQLPDKDVLPIEIDGIPVDVQEVGKLEAQ